jgi:hypothetical protein
MTPMPYNSTRIKSIKVDLPADVPDELLTIAQSIGMSRNKLITATFKLLIATKEIYDVPSRWAAILAKEARSDNH